MIFLLIFSLLSLSYQQNNSLNHLDQTFEKQNGRHFLVRWKAWQLLSGLGFFGTMSNAFLLYTFYSDRKMIATSVNAMICMDTLYRLLYSSLAIPWRTINMTQDKTFLQPWLGKDQVSIDWMESIPTFYFDLSL